MKRSTSAHVAGSTLVCCLATILIVSMIGAGVLSSSTTRFNATAKQVKGWKEALYAAEAGGDIAYAECRKAVTDPANLFSAAHGWIKDTTAVTPTWTRTLPGFGAGNTLSSEITVDEFAKENGNPYYRIRAVGIAKIGGLRRAGMDDRMNATTRGDSLLRKIDFQFDHFKATYGFGDVMPLDPGTAENGKALTAVPEPRVMRRIELIAVPIMPFEGAVKALAAFTGPGSAGVVDSYNSTNPVNTAALGSYYPDAKGQPNHAYFVDAREGNVAVNTGAFNQGNVIYGNVSTNGGNITHSNSQITGVIDNNVAFIIPPHTQPVSPAGATTISGSPSTINPPTGAAGLEADGVTKKTEFWLHYTGDFEDVVVNPAYTDTATNVKCHAACTHTTHPIETVYNIIVNGDVGDVTVNKGAMIKVHFKGDLEAKARDLVNANLDGYGAVTGVLMVNPQRDELADTDDSYKASTSTSRAGHMQFYGINPTDGSNQEIHISPPGDVWATFYAPAASLKMNGNPDVFGAVVCKSFDGNGNTGFHFDKALAGVGIPNEYRVAHYIEDVR